MRVSFNSDIWTVIYALTNLYNISCDTLEILRLLESIDKDNAWQVFAILSSS